MDQKSWQSIVDAIRSGDPQGMKRIMSLFGADLKGYARALAGDDDARFALLLEDIIVDVLRVIGASTRAKSPREFIFSSASATVRKHHDWVFREESNRRSKESDLDAILEIKKTSPLELKGAIARLAPQERELLFLRESLGFSLETVADFCGRRMSDVEEDILAARQRFRYALVANRRHDASATSEAK